VLIVVLALAVTDAPSDAEQGFAPDCGAVTRVADGKRNVSFRVRCNFSLRSMTIRISRGLSRLTKKPAIDSARSEDHLTCAKERWRRADCEGVLEVNARARGAFAVRGDPCELSARFRFDGAACTPGVVCPAVALFARARVKRPRGCG
jgi:hypothetical protein